MEECVLMKQLLRYAAVMVMPLLAGCASVGGVQDRYVVCSYDHTWEAVLDAVKDRSVTKQDKERGVIETAWLEIPMPGRTFGAFHRDMKDSKDRSRVKMMVTRIDDVTKVSFVEERERWAFRGGSRLFGWVPTESSQDVITAIQGRLNAKLKEHGCTLT